jgi:hypothetical protein
MRRRIHEEEDTACAFMCVGGYMSYEEEDT